MAQIPKVIHYCWFGGNPLGPTELKCIESWRRFLPDYRIVQWDETNFDFNSCDYASEAYRAEKWAFVSDYARFKVLYEYGGLYFDTDVELIKPIDDLIEKGSFMGLEHDFSESENDCKRINPGLGLAAAPGLDFYKAILDEYEDAHFDCLADATTQVTVVHRTTRMLYRFGMKNVSGIQMVAGIYLYPSDYFNPKDFFTGEINLSKNTRSIHHFGMSWFSKEEVFEHRIVSWLYDHGIKGKVAGKLSAAVEIIRFRDTARIKRAISKRRV